MAREAPHEGIQGAELRRFITKGIVEAHGDEIWAHSEGPDRGSTFSFRLPRQAPGRPE